MEAYLALDIGGTHLRAACFLGHDDQPIRQIRERTPAAGSDGLKFLVPLLQDLLPDGVKPAGIGLALPGIIDQHNLIMKRAVNLPGWEQLPVGSALKAAFNCPVRIDNDARLACLGEARYGAGRGCQNLIYLTIGTGIGAGILCQGSLLRGSRGLGSEAGHILLDPHGPLCACGQPGHLEALASGPAIAREVQRRLRAGERSILQLEPPPTTLQIGEAARAGDQLALSAIAGAGEWIGTALASLVHLFNPERIVLGGGVSLIGECLMESVQRGLEQHVMEAQYLQDLSVLPAGLGDDSGLYGALALIRDERA